MNTTYIRGLDVLGEETNRAILIRVKNTAQLARSQGTLATIAQTLAPATIEARVYDEMAKKLATSLKEQKVEADVSVVEPKGWQPADGKHIWQDVAIGIGVVGVLAIMWRVLGGSGGSQKGHGGRK